MIKDFQSDATENRGAKIVILKNLLFCSLNESLKIKGIWYMRQLSIFYSLYLHQTWDFLTTERPIVYIVDIGGAIAFHEIWLG